MDKLIKTISESGSFRAYVLDSTETVRTAQEKHSTLSSSTVALGRTLIANQILAANQKGESKITVKVIGNSSFGHIISVADTKGHVKGYIQNPGVDIKKTATGEVLVGLTGLEPVTPRLSSACSNQLSYRPGFGSLRDSYQY